MTRACPQQSRIVLPGNIKDIFHHASRGLLQPLANLMSSSTDASFNPFERFAMVSTATSAGFVAAPAAQLKNSHGATSTALAIGAGRTGSTAIRRHSSKGCSAAGSSEGHQGLVEKYK